MRAYTIHWVLSHCWGNVSTSLAVYECVKMRIAPVAILLAAGLAAFGTTEYLTAQRKIDLIESESLRPGASLLLSLGELNAYAAQKVPSGVSHTRISIPAAGVATGSATVDFGELRRSMGQDGGWLMSKLLDGPRPVTVTARIQSSGGEATVKVERVEISGVILDGGTLDFLIDNILTPMYPDAVVGKPFPLSHRVERLVVAPQGVTVRIGR